MLGGYAFMVESGCAEEVRMIWWSSIGCNAGIRSPLCDVLAEEFCVGSGGRLIGGG